MEKEENMNYTFEVVISYSQDSPEHIDKVISFSNFLRENGYDCAMDQLLKQTSTSIDFNEMMLKFIPNAKKVIIVLSPEYKQKTDSFTGGVGKEYRFINDDITQNETKYILVTFISLSSISKDRLLPHGLKGREIVDLTEDSLNKYELLFSKLSDTPIYDFSPVNSNKTTTSVKKIANFQPTNYISKQSIFKEVQQHLMENKQLLVQYGPASLIAIKNPLSDAIDMWNSYKQNTIIPNNRKIVDLLNKHFSLLSDSERQIFYKFKIHADAFEHNQLQRHDHDAVPLFPNEFEQMIFGEDL